MSVEIRAGLTQASRHGFVTTNWSTLVDRAFVAGLSAAGLPELPPAARRA